VPRILVLEDEPLIAMMLQGWLEEIDCETIGPAHTVQSALDLLQGARPDGALLDVSLQHGEKCYPVASDLRDRRVPFAFLTGYAAEDVDDPVQRGAGRVQAARVRGVRGRYRQDSLIASIIRPLPNRSPKTGQPFVVPAIAARAALVRRGASVSPPPAFRGRSPVPVPSGRSPTVANPSPRSGADPASSGTSHPARGLGMLGFPWPSWVPGAWLHHSRSKSWVLPHHRSHDDPGERSQGQRQAARTKPSARA
jgi:CheY-like chemotaxis protein